MHLSDYLAILCLDIYAEKRKHMSLQRLVYEFLGSVMCCVHKWKTIRMSNRWMDKHVVGYLHNESQYAYAECKKKGKDRESKYCVSSIICNSRNANYNDKEQIASGLSWGGFLDTDQINNKSYNIKIRYIMYIHTVIWSMYTV